MNQITRVYTFQRSGESLVPSSPRSLKDLQQQELHQQAAKLAESVEKEALEVDTFIKSFEGKPQDQNQDFPGHVTISEQGFQGKKLSGSTVRASHHPRELNGTQATLTKKNFFWFDKKTDYRLSADGTASRVSNPGGRQEVRESVGEKDGIVRLTVTGKPGSHALLAKEEGQDFGLPETQNTKSYRNFKLKEERHFDEQEPWHWTDTSRITDPNKAADRAAAQAANNAIQEVMGLYDQAMALDQSEADLNDRPGEVLFEKAQLGERVVSGSIRPMYTRKGNTAEQPGAGSYFQKELKPYMEMKSHNTGEIFQATLGSVWQSEGDYGDNRASEIFVHSTPERTVKARVGESRHWYVGEEPGWYPHPEADVDFPMASDRMGGSVLIRS